MPWRAAATVSYALMNTSSYFRLRHKRSMKMLSRYRPLPSMLIRTPRSSSSDRKSALVNCTPLVSVEDLRCPVSVQRLLQRLDAECRVHADRHLPGQAEGGRT